MERNSTNFKVYRQQVSQALNDKFLRRALENFASIYRPKRALAIGERDAHALVEGVVAAKGRSLPKLMDVYRQFKEVAEARGVKVHLAKDAREAREIIAKIAADNNVKTMVKGKSLTSEEILLNPYLEERGIRVTETDLGEWIVQLRNEPPSHMLAPAIHLSRDQVAELFTEVSGTEQEVDIEKLVKVSRVALRPRFAEADMGFSGINFAVAQTATIGLISNEGNVRISALMPKVHVFLGGLEKLYVDLNDALSALAVVTPNGVMQRISSYVTWVTGPLGSSITESGSKETHVVFLDNGRTELLQDPDFSQVLRCVRCGACANVCPIFRMVGGYRMGHIYIGAIGLLLTYFFHGEENAKNLVQNCINCGACQDICSAGIELPRLIKEVNARLTAKDKGARASRMAANTIVKQGRYHRLLKTARFLQKPFVGQGNTVRHLPMGLLGPHGFKSLPALAPKFFREQWPALKKEIVNPRYKVALFSGCSQDFIFPEQLTAVVELLHKFNVAAEFPMAQNCCGLPLQMLGQKQAAVELAKQNLDALGSDYDYIISACASCASQLRNSYYLLLKDDPAYAEKARIAGEKVVDIASFMHNVLLVSSDDFKERHERVGYHAPCHLARESFCKSKTAAPEADPATCGPPPAQASRIMLNVAGAHYVPMAEEEVCCGFGGTFSLKFPEISAELLNKKMEHAAEADIDVLVSDCPGCLMQLNGGAVKQGRKFKVTHIAQYMRDNLK